MNIVENECFYLALLLNNIEYFKDTPIKSKYLTDRLNQKIFAYSKECYEKYEIVDINKMHNERPDVIDNNLIDYFHKLYIDTFRWNSNKDKHKIEHEKIIVDNYKTNVIKELTHKLELNAINLKDFVKKMNEINDIQIVSDTSSMLTIENVDMSKDEVVEYVKSNTVQLDAHTKGFALGQLSVWSGGNGSAKSTYLNQIAIESINQGYNVAIYSGELMPKRLLNWIFSQCAGKKNMIHNDGKDYWYIKNEIKEKIGKWLNKKLYIYDNAQGNKVENVMLNIKSCIKKNNIKILIIDNLMSLNIGNDNKYDNQSNFVKELSSLAKEENIHIHFVCHPRKATGFLRKMDISGTADLSNIADNVFILHRTNVDFKMKAKELFGWSESAEIYKYSNVLEICKNRDFGWENVFVGMFYESESKRLMDFENERRVYKWEQEK